MGRCRRKVYLLLEGAVYRAITTACQWCGNGRTKYETCETCGGPNPLIEDPKTQLKLRELMAVGFGAALGAGVARSLFRGRPRGPF